MPPEALAAPPLHRLLVALPAAWRRPLVLLGAAWLVLISLFLADWRAMAGQWWDTSTYNHVLLVPAILAWLVALRQRELAKLEPAAWGPGLVVVTGPLSAGCSVVSPDSRWLVSWVRWGCCKGRR